MTEAEVPEEKARRSGTVLGRFNRRFPAFKIAVLIGLIVGGVGYLILSSVAREGKLTFEIVLERKEIAYVSEKEKTEEEPAEEPAATPVSEVIAEPDLTGKMLVALTFDDGPDAGVTPRILDILHEKQVPATFFVLGSKMRNLPEIVQRAEREGHEVESHSLWHGNLSTFSREAVFDDYEQSKAVFNEVLGHDFKMLRPPYGAVNAYVRELPVPLMTWSVDTEDWKSKDAGSILWRVQNDTFDGAVILMHDVYDTTAEAVGPVIDDLRSKGYEFVTVVRLAELRGVELTPGFLWGRFRVDGE